MGSLAAGESFLIRRGGDWLRLGTGGRVVVVVVLVVLEDIVSAVVVVLLVVVLLVVVVAVVVGVGVEVVLTLFAGGEVGGDVMDAVVVIVLGL